MKKPLPFLDHDSQSSGPQYLEDLATGYWFSELLFASVEMDLFSQLEPEGSILQDLAITLGADPAALSRLLDALISIGLVTDSGGRYFNTVLSRECLVRGSERYQGDSILWRRYLRQYWNGLGTCVRTGGRTGYKSGEDTSEREGRIRKYIRAMDSVAVVKAGEILQFFSGMKLKGNILDAGAGSGAVTAAFLSEYPDLKATLLDLPEVIGQTERSASLRKFRKRVQFLAGNILEKWPVRNHGFDLVILSNILHAYSEKELPHILAAAAAALRKKGLLLIHDFFSEHYPAKAALSDLNMLINTYNGRVFSSGIIQKELSRLGLSQTPLMPLETDTGVIIASGSKAALGSLKKDPMDRFMARMGELGFRRSYRISAEDICMAEWTDIKCRFGCGRFGSPNCPPNSLSHERTGAMIKTFSRAVLVEGEPPARDFQRMVLQAEREAFISGYHRAFSFWAGPCSLCDPCVNTGRCRNTADARPSMEGAGIDVFETVRRAGGRLRTLKAKNEFVKYFGLILLD